MIVLTDADFRRLVPMVDAIHAVREVFVAVAGGRVDQPHRIMLAGGAAVTMMARVEPHADVVVKTVTIRPDNARLGIPSLHAVVLWFDGATGRPSMLVEGAAVTAVRTGAASGVATDLLARPDARVLTMIGAGGQAADQIDAVRTVRPIAEVRIVSRGRARAEGLAERLRAMTPAIAYVVHDRIDAAVQDADIICCATTATTPLFSLAELSPGVHINAVGAYTAGMSEVAPEVLARAGVIAVDQIEAALVEAGDLIQALEAGAIGRERLREIGHLVQGKFTRAPDEITVFKSVGLAAQDWAVAGVAARRVEGLAGLQEVQLDDPARSPAG